MPMNKVIRFAGMACCAALLAGTLAGCSSEPKTPEAVVEKFQSIQQTTNYRMTGTISTDLKMKSGDFDMDMPVKMDVDASYVGAQGKGAMTTTADVLGTQTRETTEFYTDGETVWSRTDGGDWYATQAGTGEGQDTLDTLRNLASPDAVKGAEMAKTEDGYEIALTGEALASSPASGPLLAMARGGNAAEESEEGKKDGFDSGAVRYIFDKDCRLTGLKIEDVTYSQSSGEVDVGDSYDMTMTLGADLKFSNYDQEAAIKIPDDVISGAKQSALDLLGSDLFSRGDDEADDEDGGTAGWDGESNEYEIGAGTSDEIASEPDSGEAATEAGEGR